MPRFLGLPRLPYCLASESLLGDLRTSGAILVHPVKSGPHKTDHPVKKQSAKFRYIGPPIFKNFRYIGPEIFKIFRYIGAPIFKNFSVPVMVAAQRHAVLVATEILPVPLHPRFSAAMVDVTQPLPVTDIPEKRRIAFVLHDVIDFSREPGDAVVLAHDA